MNYERPVESTYREPPFNNEAEQALLGAIMINNRAYERVSDFLLPDHFANGAHARIYSAASRLIEKGQIASPVTLKGMFDQDQALQELGGAQYLVKLAASVVSVINAKDYGTEIRECFLRRCLIEAGETLINDAFDRDLDHTAQDIIDELQSGLDTFVSAGEISEGLEPVQRGADAAMAHIAAATKNGGALLGHGTGLIGLDTGSGGLMAPDLIVLAARPSMGKTSLARQVAFHVAESIGPVAFFSLEMSALQQNLSLLAALAHIPVVDVLRGDVADKGPALEAARKRLKDAPLFIDGRAALKVSQIKSECRRLKRSNGLAAVFVDYLQLMRPEGRVESQNLGIAQISSGLKQLAKELDVPVVALSQLSRAVELREDKRPVLSDLRDSGAIEQDADQVWFLYRQEYYVRKQEPQEGSKNYWENQADWRARLDRCKGKAEVDVAKRRMGPTGRVDLRFYGQTTAFGDLV